MTEQLPKLPVDASVYANHKLEEPFGKLKNYTRAKLSILDVPDPVKAVSREFTFAYYFTLRDPESKESQLNLAMKEVKKAGLSEAELDEAKVIGCWMLRDYFDPEAAVPETKGLKEAQKEKKPEEQPERLSISRKQINHNGLIRYAMETCESVQRIDSYMTEEQHKIYWGFVMALVRGESVFRTKIEAAGFSPEKVEKKAKGIINGYRLKSGGAYNYLPQVPTKVMKICLDRNSPEG